MKTKDDLMRRIRSALCTKNDPLGQKTEGLEKALEVLVNEIAEKPQLCIICERECEWGDDRHPTCAYNARRLRD